LTFTQADLTSKDGTEDEENEPGSILHINGADTIIVDPSGQLLKWASSQAHDRNGPTCLRRLQMTCQQHHNNDGISSSHSPDGKSSGHTGHHPTAADG
jgi:hypothetical protein